MAENGEPVRIHSAGPGGGARVVWPTRRETLVTTALVMLLAVAASLFLLVVDEGLRIARQLGPRLRASRLSASAASRV